MKFIIQAVSASLLIHIVYLLSILLLGYFQTNAYVYDNLIAFHKVDKLQNEVTFGIAISPIFGGFSLIGGALISEIGIALYNRTTKNLSNIEFLRRYKTVDKLWNNSSN